jgi:hypothetical protein
MLFFRYYLKARTARCYSLYRYAIPLYSYYTSATASHTGLCALTLESPIYSVNKFSVYTKKVRA